MPKSNAQNGGPSAAEVKPDALLLLADGRIFEGFAIGKDKPTFGEICFNTSITGYQEILTDPSYAGQIIVFTFPHIGNVGTNAEDIEARQIFAQGLVVREAITSPANFRSSSYLNEWLINRGLSGISGVDTRALTRHIRKHGAQNVAIFRGQISDKKLIQSMKEKLGDYPSMKGLDLAKNVTISSSYEWNEPQWKLNPQARAKNKGSYHVVAIDYGIKQNILRSLASFNCRITVVPAKTTVKEILALNPDGVFLSNGPGDPAATGEYAIPVIQELLKTNIPMFGICLGHQMLGLAAGAKTEKMMQGHRGANHPVKDLETGKVEITSQNHGFVIAKDSLPDNVIATHVSLFDGTNQGIRIKDKPVFSVQGHPEASPGPHDSQYLFERFTELMEIYKKSENKTKAGAA